MSKLCAEVEMAISRSRYEFKVLIEGIDLDPDSVARINGALQRAMLNEVASLDLGSKELAYRPLMSELISRDAAAKEGNGGSTGGVAIRAVNPRR
jgi:hypothetical protein